jgi:hypothetical protein
MASQKLHFRPLFLILFTLVLLITAAISSITNIQAQDGLLPLPGAASPRDFNEMQVLDRPAGYLRFGDTIDADGDLLLVSAKLDDTHQTEVVLVYHLNSSGIWVYEATLQPDNQQLGDGFGVSLEISGNTAFIGAPFARFIGDDSDEDAEKEAAEGLAYFFERDSGGVWTQVAEVHGSTRGQDYFSERLALDGNFAAGIQNPVIGGEGSATAFERNGSGIWEADGGMIPPLGLPGAGDVDIKGNIGALAASDNDDDSQNVIIFERSGGGWVATQTITADAGDNFSAMELGDNNTLFVTKLVFNNPNTVLVFKNTGGTWSEVQELVLDGTTHSFGSSLATDGSLLAIGNPNDTTPNGAVYLFSWNGSAWVRVDKLTDTAAGLKLGGDIALDGLNLFVSALSDTNQKVYIYSVNAQPPMTPEPTQDPGQPTSEPTSEPGQPTFTPVPPTQTPVPPTATTVPPTSTQEAPPEQTPDVDGQVLANRSFEQQLTQWTLKNASADKVKCNKPTKTVAYEGVCAFQFKGSTGESAKLTQVVSGVQAGHMLTLSGFVKAKGSDITSKVKVIVIYADGITPKSKITVNVGSPTGGVYVPLSNFQPMLTATVTSAPEKVKFIIKNKGTSGKVIYDALSLIAQ